jgi:hypothetical protein
MHRPPAHAPRVLQLNRERYGHLVGVVSRFAAEGDHESVMRAAALAANYAWGAPTGMIADPALERTVVASVCGARRVELDGARRTGRVLHVLTEAYDLGGHTRLAWRWIERDPRRTDVALTAQRDPVPANLLAAVERSGGTVHDLRSSSHELTGRARTLRGLLDDVDLVVQHAHPWDPVPLVAANLPGPRPPVVLENHAEHTAWIGLGGADVVSDYHAFSHRVSHGLRGVPTSRLGLVPIPLDEHAAPSPREDLRRRLGLRPGTVVGLTVASPHKLAPMWGRGMSALLDRALTWCRQLTVVLVGPPATGPWAKLASRHPGRVLALGPVPDAAPYYAAADLYLDSYPSRSGTAVLEAALHGLPVLSLADLGEAHGHGQLYQADSPGLTANPRAASQEQYTSMLRRLVDDAGLRAERGAAVRDAVRAAHCGEGWSGAMEALYARARSVPAVDLAEYGDAVVDERYGALLLGYSGSGPDSPPVTAAGTNLPDEPTPRLAADVVVLASRDSGSRVHGRVPAGWEEHRDWTSRLLALAGDHPRLAVSLPFLRGDDARGTRTTTLLEGLLAELGATPEDCGDIRVESTPRPLADAALRFDLDLLTGALDRLEEVLASPSWRPARPAAPVRATA